MALLIPEHETNHPQGTHRKCVSNRAAMNAIFFVLRTGCQWNALNATGICSSSSAIIVSRNGGMPGFLNGSDPQLKESRNYEAMLHFTCGIIVWNKILLG